MQPKYLAGFLAGISLLTTTGCAAEFVRADAPADPSVNAPSSSATSSRPTNDASVAATPAPSTATTSPTPTPSDTPSDPETSAPVSSDSATSAAPAPSSATPSPVVLLRNGSSGDKVRELQHRLLQLQWFAGPIGPNYGSTTAAAVSGFQAKRGLGATGELDQTTWDTLVKMTATPTHEQMFNVPAGPAIMRQGQDSAQIKELQARLKQLDWFNETVTGHYGEVTTQAVTGFQVRRGLVGSGQVDQRTWNELLSLTQKPSKTDLDPSANPKAADGVDPRCMSGRVLCISKDSNTLRWVVDGKVRLTMDVRFGTELTPTREGEFTVFWKHKDHVSTIYHTKMPYAMFFSGGQAVHYSSDFAARGFHGGSHGCVNVRDLDALQQLYAQVREGDHVVVYR